jgi:hypothetical protein
MLAPASGIMPQDEEIAVSIKTNVVPRSRLGASNAAALLQGYLLR